MARYPSGPGSSFFAARWRLLARRACFAATRRIQGFLNDQGPSKKESAICEREVQRPPNPHALGIDVDRSRAVRILRGIPEDMGAVSMGTSFKGVLVKNADKITDRKSLVICGAPRGGTSFAASVFSQLGVPFRRTSKDRISPRYEHNRLKEAFLAEDSERMQQIIDEFCQLHSVWAWKLPAIEQRFSAIADIVPNPHFVVIFKEPLSVAVRSAERRAKTPIHVLQSVVAVQQRLAAIAAETKHPLLLVSYEKAMMNLPAFLSEAASFSGIRSYDEAAVISGIAVDGKRYLGEGSGVDPSSAPTV